MCSALMPSHCLDLEEAINYTSWIPTAVSVLTYVDLLRYTAMLAMYSIEMINFLWCWEL